MEYQKDTAGEKFGFSMGAKIYLSVYLATLITLILSAFRGGFNIYVAIIFFLTSFSVVWFGCWLFSIRRLHLFGGPPKSAREAWIRDGLVFVLIVCVLFGSGIMTGNASYAAPILIFFLAVVLPLVICWISGRAPIFWGIATVTALLLSTDAHRRDTSFRLLDFTTWGHSMWVSMLTKDPTVFASVWLIAIGLSLAVSVPLTVQRARLKRQAH